MPEPTWSVELATSAVDADQLERVHAEAAQRHLDLDPAPREPVRALAADLHRRGGRNRQLDLPSQLVEPRLEVGAGERLVPLEHLAFADRRSRSSP